MRFEVVGRYLVELFHSSPEEERRVLLRLTHCCHGAEVSIVSQLVKICWSLV
jgi:hypothetical protein